ncbi:hypothetical protein BU23DRAFT_571151 [Bimuria novae-zelandiae CBS 107.79]|uniref:Integral membrane protein n=1 Tax=Bimuria novae-zelandiae CBS 107.79 TaxID=1447943 RepID=A0A6A5V475_9PLEO|nr:hypothetical protein BU23DRAFT_571151 [Bimuria novae-zelandiae CBS 107.79]
MYELTNVSTGVALPYAHFLHNAHRFLVGSNVTLIMFYVGLWSIKLGFLVFFYRLGDQIRTYQTFWWIVLVFTVASGLVCIGDIQYHCLSDPTEKVLVNCPTESAIRFQEITIKLNCALDVVTDVMIFAIVRVTVVSQGYTTSHYQAEISWLCFWSFMEFSIAFAAGKHEYGTLNDRDPSKQ